MSSFSPASPSFSLQPARIVPPYTMMAGRFRRAIAMRQPGMFLSQPGSAMQASYHCAPITVSMESAIRSRDWREKLIPSVPIEIPSETPTVLKRYPTIPASCTPVFTSPAKSKRCILHGLPSYQTLAIPTWALFISSSEIPVAYSIAWEAPWDLGWVILLLILFSSGSSAIIDRERAELILATPPMRLCGTTNALAVKALARAKLPPRSWVNFPMSRDAFEKLDLLFGRRFFISAATIS
mmetsp:Transcript_33778/g.58381  ORF Transcript_33778/g.58381 Transcript_33778/m.58381 type:complete len:239 (+) Transcript_33778:1118-1834(+)